MFDLSDVEFLQEGVSDKNRVLKLMGSPTFISDLSGRETWIYYSEEVKRLLFFKPITVQRNVLSIRFGENELISEMKKITLDNENRKLDFLSEYTSVDSHKIGFFKSFFSNVGQVKPQ